MKKAALLLLSLCLVLAPVTSLAEKATRTVFSDTIWDIPWYITPEEFVPLVQQKQRLTFLPTDNPYIYTLNQPSNYTCLGEPVDSINVYFARLGLDLGILSGNPDIIYSDIFDSSYHYGHFQGLYINIAPLSSPTTLADRVAQYAALTKQMYAQYGEPYWSALLVQHIPDPKDIYDYDLYHFTFPVALGIFEQSVALQALNDPYSVVVLSAIFRNRHLTLRYEPLKGIDSCEIRLLVQKNCEPAKGADFPPYTEFIPMKTERP